METRIIFARMPVKPLFFKKLFNPTSNGIAVKVRYVPSTAVVLDVILNDLLRRMQTM